MFSKIKETYTCKECNQVYVRKWCFDVHTETKKHKDRLIQLQRVQDKINKKIKLKKVSEFSLDLRNKKGEIVGKTLVDEEVSSSYR